MIILIDCDDTIWNLCEAWIDWLNQSYGTSVAISDIKEWDMKKAFPSLTPEDIYTPLTYEYFWKTVQPKEDAIKYIPMIEQLGHKVYFVTATVPHNVLFKANMLKKWFPTIPIDRLIIAHDKTLIRGSVMIDDNVNNLKNRDFSILFTAQHNKSIDLSESSIIRLDNWCDIYNYIKEYI